MSKVLVKATGAVTLVVLAACGGKDASTLTHPPRSASFPMYVSIPGKTVGTGSIYQIPAPSSTDTASEPVQLLANLNFPAAVAVDRSGTVYYTERPTPTTGRLMRYMGEGIEPLEIVTGLYDPQGLIVDNTGHLYVAETGANRISLVNSTEKTLVDPPVTTDVLGPMQLGVDEQDNLYVSEAVGGKVSKLIPDGTKETIAEGLMNPLDVGPGLVGNIFYMVANSGNADGETFLVNESGGKSSYLDHLINPKSFDWEDSTILYVAEGAPSYRVIKYSRVSGTRTETASLPGDPHTLVFTPD